MLCCIYLLGYVNIAFSLPMFVDDKPLVSDCIQKLGYVNCGSKAKAMGAGIFSAERGKDEKETFRQAAADRAACIELREEYIKVCAVTTAHKVENDSLEFCEAYEVVCFEIPEGEPDQPTIATRPPIILEEHTTPSPKHKSKDYAELCREYKQRYLYVCPDPFRFGQKAIIFCPLYAQKCHVPLPDKPVLPTRPPPVSQGRSGISTVDRLCAQYRNFAQNYCNNPLVLSQPRYKDACEKYRRFCVHN